jgi:iron complex outermembrane receptor protein
MEIVVTAQRRSENLERTPVAVSVVSAEELSKDVVLSESDLRTEVPGLTVRETISSNALNYCNVDRYAVRGTKAVRATARA